MAPWHRSGGQGAALSLPPAQPRLRGQNLGSSARPSSSPSPPPPRQPGQRPPPPQQLWAPAAAAPAARTPPLPQQPGLSPQINGLPNTPAPPVQYPASQSDRQPEMERPAEPGTPDTQTHAQTTSTQKRTLWARNRAPGGNNRARSQRGEGKAARYGAWGVGEHSGLKAKGLETWQGLREPETVRAGPGGRLRRPVLAALSHRPTRGVAVEGAGGSHGIEAWRAKDRSPLSQASHPLPGLEEGSGMDWAVRVM